MGWRNLNYILGIMLWAWCGMAYAQQQDGLNIELSYIGEEAWNTGGGLNKGSLYHGFGDLVLYIDTEQAGWWQGGTLIVEGLINHGRDPSRFIGDIQTASNIADGSRTRLQQLWYEQLFGEYLSVLAGLHDLNSEFYVSEYGSLFLNSSFGVGPELSANVASSLWPEAGWATRIALHGEHLYARIAAYDGDPATRALRPGSEGLMWIAEVGFQQGATAYKLGAWHHTATKTGPDGSIFSSDSGVYAIIDQEIVRGFGLFLQLGYAQPKRNEIANYAGLGIHWDGPIPGRSADQFGIAVARAGFSHVNRRVNGLAAAETSVEITYDLAMTDWLSIQPDMQWIQHPGGDPQLAAAQVVMLRVELTLP